MKKSRGISVLIAGGFLLLVSVMVNSCGQDSNSTTTTTLPSSLGVTISGKLSTGIVASGTLSSSGVKAQAVAQSAIVDYNIVAVSKEDGRIYFASAETDASGNFTVPNFPAGESFYLEVLDTNLKLVAPVALGSSGGKAIMAADSGSETSINLSNIVYDSSKKVAAPTTEPTALLDTGSGVTPKNGESLVPSGAGNLGKGALTQISGTAYDSTKVDGDKDGLPNVLDADNNGDLIPDEFDGFFTKEVLSVTLPMNFYPYLFTNLKIDFDNRNTFTTNYSEFDVVVGVTATKTFGGKTIASVEVTSGPSWIGKATINNSATLWSSTGYNVPAKAGTDSFEIHLGGLKPLTDVNAGDAIKYKVTYSDGTSERAIKMINFVFTDIPRATAYKIGSGSWQTAFPASGPVASASTSEVSLRWTRPKDETGSEITGARYTFEYNSISSGAKETEVIAKDTSSATSLEATLDIAQQPDASMSAADFMVGLCVRSRANDNSAENLRFTKGW